MRLAFALSVLLALALSSGCGPRQEASRAPLQVGKLEGGTFWKSPLSAASNEGGDYPKGSRVEIYDQFVVVTPENGISHVHPHGYYSGLAFKRD
jgi:hypothetical protein